MLTSPILEETIETKTEAIAKPQPHVRIVVLNLRSPTVGAMHHHFLLV
ncbi:MAG: hypothetical protein AAF378_07030 [Cyanobacteria bacterium P01_A01_bin.84]